MLINKQTIRILSMQAFCPCCVATTEWRVTGQGIRWRKNRAALDCCGDVETQFIDYRFMKDIELRREPKCCCFCVGSELLIFADDKDSVRYVGGKLISNSLSLSPLYKHSH